MTPNREVDADTLRQEPQALLEIVHLAAPCLNVPVTFTLSVRFHLPPQIALGR